MRHLATICCAVLVVVNGCSKHADEPVISSQEAAVETTPRKPLHPELVAYIAETIPEFDRISEERRERLRRLARFVADGSRSERTAKLVFICTHNSRRSHMSQLWAQTAAHHFGVDGVATYSGGTEATAFNPRAMAAIERAGFTVEKTSDGDNPVYAVRFAGNAEPMECFSKVYDQPPNPREDFAAVMTCSAADAACPIVFGADERISIPFEDPKEYDGTDRESAMYDERCRQIAREMLYVFSQVSAI